MANIYAAAYNTQLVYMFMLAINYEHICDIGLKKALFEDRKAKTASNVLTMALIVIIPTFFVVELTLFAVQMKKEKLTKDQVKAKVDNLKIEI